MNTHEHVGVVAPMGGGVHPSRALSDNPCPFRRAAASPPSTSHPPPPTPAHRLHDEFLELGRALLRGALQGRPAPVGGVGDEQRGPGRQAAQGRAVEVGLAHRVHVHRVAVPPAPVRARPPPAARAPAPSATGSPTPTNTGTMKSTPTPEVISPTQRQAGSCVIFF